MPIINLIYNAPEWNYEPNADTLFYYNIDNSDTSSVLYDKAGNYNMNWTGTPSYDIDANVGRYVKLGSSGNNAYTTATAYVQFGDEYTYHCLVYFIGPSRGVFYSQGGGTSNGLNRTIEFGDNPYIYFRTRDGYNLQASGVVLNKRVLYSFVLSTSQNFKGIYANGNLLASGTANNNTWLGNEYGHIGIMRTGVPYNCNCYMKMFLSEKRAWSGTEISEFNSKIKKKYGL